MYNNPIEKRGYLYTEAVQYLFNVDLLRRATVRNLPKGSYNHRLFKESTFLINHIRSIHDKQKFIRHIKLQ
ncbi:hypothetical protein SAMN05443550_1362 [Pedobacter hartonius]|uniref:Uncharacterized protein n=1 Tax=Pedobacter hartonius TaxID=425514 RepID=A0A1H4HKW5_9SPHI|nr:hypothetical protein SAMN05443550_1362 [Pedobacter hartonius]